MSFRLTFCSLLALAAASPALADPVFNRIASFATLDNMAEGADPAVLHAVSDSAYASQPAIYRIETGQPATITDKIVVTEGGKPAEKLDLEGISADGQGGYWLASEGNPEKDIPHQILHVDAKGAIAQRIELPTALVAQSTRFGLESIAMAPDGSLWMAVQREWKDDPKGQAKLLNFNPKTGAWTGVRYPLESGEGWVGLSELAIHGDRIYLIERDNQIGQAAVLKQVTSVALDGLKPALLDGALPLVEKRVERDLIPDLKRWNGYVQEKVEGMAITPDGTVWAVTDNDGLDDASGETFLWSFRLGTPAAAR